MVYFHYGGQIAEYYKREYLFAIIKGFEHFISWSIYLIKGSLYAEFMIVFSLT